MKRFAILVFLAILALSLLGVSSAASDTPLAGDLDSSFGAGGVVAHSVGAAENSRVEAIAVQQDGKIVATGDSNRGEDGFLLARYLRDGSPDPSFGNGGYVETHFPDAASADAVAVQPDGKIVVAGSETPGGDIRSVFALARYSPDGSLDTSFGTGGITTTAIPEQSSPSSAGAEALAILPGGEILAGGSAGFETDAITLPTSFFALVRYKPDGSVDPTFGQSGIVQTRFDGNLGLWGIAVRPDGKIVAAGTASGPGHGLTYHRMALALYKPDGALDTAFGHLGTAASSATLNYDGGPSTLQDGGIVVAGETHNGFPVLARYTAGGRLDPTFGKEGFRKITRLHGGSTAIRTQTDGKILVGLRVARSGGAEAGVIVRLTRNGRLDPSFGRGGIVPLSRGLLTTALTTQADGKILVGGGSGDSWTVDRFIGGNNCVVPDLRGKTVSKARALLKTSYCRTGRIAKRLSRKVTRGRVISTTPLLGDRRPGGAKIDLVVSKGLRP